MRPLLFLVIASLVTTSFPAFAQNRHYTVTSYYPSPTGNYQNLNVNHDLNVANNVGIASVLNTNNLNVAGVLGVNVLNITGSLGVGTPTPQARLDIRG
ncbi:MAG: hypothetical protein HQL16_05690, partial [Candidatus Omnitrophica bacterium]|nr:hypothetical protein [Candidatus Omnitrophota bacterium]